MTGYPWRIGPEKRTRWTRLWVAPVIDLSGTIRWWGPRRRTRLAAVAAAARTARRANRQGTL